MKEFTVPDYPMYIVTEDGNVYSSYGKKSKPRRKLKQNMQLKHPGTKRLYCYVSLQVPGENRKKTFSLPRLMLAAKLGRWLEPWEQARHLDGDCNNNHMDNLGVGCVINNMLDDIENGSRQTDEYNIRLAIKRLEALL